MYMCAWCVYVVCVHGVYVVVFVYVVCGGICIGLYVVCMYICVDGVCMYE